MNQSTPAPNIVYIGVDVDSKSLQLHGMARRKQLPNTGAGHATLIGLLPASAHVIMESSGGYEKALWLALLRAGCRVSRLNARRVRCLAGTKGQWAKSDPRDAALLAEFGAKLVPKPDVLPTEARLELEDLVCRREQLVNQRAQCDVQSQQLRRESLMEQAAALLAFLDEQIHALDIQIERCLKGPELAAKAQRLQQVCGVGPGVCSTLLATMPELGNLSDTQAAALLGVAPYDDDSGQYRGARHIRGGRVRPRRALYMAALCASRHNPILRAFHQRLLNKGKPFKVAITAVMRKLIILLNRLIREPHFMLDT
jgi:transposase